MSEGAVPDHDPVPKTAKETLMDSLPDRFHYHPPSPEGVARHGSLTTLMESAAQGVVAICPLGREQALALTKLEEAKFWASASVARNPLTR
jgi:chorismate-pyruvate lyase